MARWILSLGIDWARAASTAARSRGFASGSGRPIFAATVISRESLENIAERFLSCAPLRYMMFLNLLWPAIGHVLHPPSRHCEERSDEAIHLKRGPGWIASLRSQ